MVGGRVREGPGVAHTMSRRGQEPGRAHIWCGGMVAPLGHPRWLSTPFYVKTSNINFSGFFEKLYFLDFSRILINNNNAGKRGENIVSFI